jgi:hypothetical protein
MSHGEFSIYFLAKAMPGLDWFLALALKAQLSE